MQLPTTLGARGFFPLHELNREAMTASHRAFTFRCSSCEEKPPQTPRVVTYYSRLPLSWTRLSRKPRYLELKSIPIALVFQSFTISYLELLTISNCFSFPLRVRDNMIQVRWDLESMLVFSGIDLVHMWHLISLHGNKAHHVLIVASSRVDINNKTRAKQGWELLRVQTLA